jgi:putative GTP pyrophosphokinase
VNNNTELLKSEFQKVEPRAERLRLALLQEISKLLDNNNVVLGVPLESRVKTWPSLLNKLERKSIELKTLATLSDLIGLRVILLFRSDLDIVVSLLKKTFLILNVEDTSARLEESQFGYQSQHLTLRLPAAWSEIPSFSDLCDLMVEVQVRTVAQHIWAAASHKLQYKNESNVPPPLRRTIHRISALLETVDLELDRVLVERRSYTDRQKDSTSDTEILNVDLLESLLLKILPPQNLDFGGERYANLLEELLHFGITTPAALEALIAKHRQSILEVEKQYVESELNDSEDVDRRKRQVYFTHVGLTRQGLCEEFGNEALREFWAMRDEN